MFHIRHHLATESTGLSWVTNTHTLTASGDGRTTGAAHVFVFVTRIRWSLTRSETFTAASPRHLQSSSGRTTLSRGPSHPDRRSLCGRPHKWGRCRVQGRLVNCGAKEWLAKASDGRGYFWATTSRAKSGSDGEQFCKLVPPTWV